MKVRVLYPTVVETHVKGAAKAGSTVEIEDSVAESLLASGVVERVDAKPVEQATAAPGETKRKRGPGRPRKDESESG